MFFSHIQVLNENNINQEYIGAFVFDTTSVNTGHKNGIVVQLERYLGRNVLQLECRHHVLELVVGASCSFVYGPTSGPKEDFFKKLIDKWSDLDLNNYTTVEAPRHQRELSCQIEESISFLLEWVNKSTKQCLRHDYLEMVSLVILFLGGPKLEKVGVNTIKAPGAYNHARWMSKVLYTLKIALFRHQLGEVYAPEDLENIYNLSIFISIFYVKAWLTCTDASNAPLNDLELMKKFLKAEERIKTNTSSYPSTFSDLIRLAREKLQNHMGYLSERLVPFAIFSDHVTTSMKKKMKDAMLRNQNEVENVPQKMPHSEKFSSKFLYDFIGNDSWKMFQLLGIDHTFLNIPVKKWKDSSTYLNGKEILSNLPVVNDAAERALGIATEKNTKTAPKSDCQRQALYKVVKGIRERLGKLATSTEVVTKKSLNSIDYSWKEKNDI